MSNKIYIFFLFFIFSRLVVFSQTDTTNYNLNRLTADNVIEHVNEGEITVVSASRSNKKIEDLPVTIHVVTNEEILLNGYVTLVDVLKSLPSIRVSQPGSGENGEMFMMRGLVGNQYTKILVDNIPLKASVLTGLPIESQLPIRQAERIEIIYGPASAIYGADAAIGVINIITKKSKSSIFSTADIFSGTNGYQYTNFHVGGKAGRNQKILEYSFFGSNMDMKDMNIFSDTAVFHPLSYLEQNGLKVYVDGHVYLPTELNQDILDNYNIPTETFFHTIKNYDGTVSSPEISEIPTKSSLFGVTLRYKKIEFSYLFMYRQTHSSIGRTPYLYKYNDNQFFIADYNSKISISYNTNLRKILSSTSLILSGYRYDDNSSYGVTFIPNFEKGYVNANSNDAFLEQLYTYNYKFLEIVGGLSANASMNLPLTNYLPQNYIYAFQIIPKTTIEVNTTDFEKFGINPYMFVALSGFFQVYLDFKRLKIVGGIRQEFNTLFEEPIFIPRIAFLYSFNNNHSIRISSGQAYKPPAGNLLFQSLAFPINPDGETDSVQYAVIPNPSLQPEYFEAHEFGYRGSFFDKNLTIDFAYYYNKVKNLIISTLINPKIFYDNAVMPNGEFSRFYLNNDQAVTSFYGIDLAVTIKNIYKPKNVNINFSATYTYGQEELPTGETIKYLRGIPTYMFKINISGNPTRRIYINIQNTIMSGWKRSFLPYKEYYNLNPSYPNIKGYFTTDVTFGYRIHKNLNIFAKITNFFNNNYGGIDATSFDVDLKYNPQLGQNIKFGLTFIMN